MFPNNVPTEANNPDFSTSPSYSFTDLISLPRNNCAGSSFPGFISRTDVSPPETDTLALHISLILRALTQTSGATPSLMRNVSSAALYFGSRPMASIYFLYAVIYDSAELSWSIDAFSVPAGRTDFTVDVPGAIPLYKLEKNAGLSNDADVPERASRLSVMSFIVSAVQSAKLFRNPACPRNFEAKNDETILPEYE